jgi:FkbM family methyltransferase
VISRFIRRHFRGSRAIRAALLWLYPAWIALLRRVWRVRNRIIPGKPVCVRTGAVEVRLIPEGQIAEMVWTTDFEPWERDFVAAHVRPGMRVVNVGANVGLYAVMCSKLVGEAGEVHAFEPSSVTFDRLRQNVALNGCRNVHAHRLAVAEESGQLVLRSDPSDASLDGHRFVEDVSRVEDVAGTDEIVECRSLDEHFSSGGSLPAVDFAIIDVEGAESLVLEGATRLISGSPRLTILVECSRELPRVEQTLVEHGFSFFGWDMERGSLTPLPFGEAVARGNVIARRPG